MKLPKRPRVSPLTRRAMWLWFVELQSLCASTALSVRDAQQLETELRALIDQFEALRNSAPTEANDREMDVHWNAHFHRFLGICLHVSGRNAEALSELQFAASADPWNMHHVEELVITCLRAGEIDLAVSTVNSLTREQIETENSSTAVKLLRWGMQWPDFLAGIEAAQIKTMLQLAAAYPEETAGLMSCVSQP